MEKGKIKDFILKIILEKCSFLEQQGYEFAISIPNYATVIEAVDVEYKCAVKRREITISYTQSKVYDNINYTLTTYIVRTPYEDATIDFFSLDIYLASLGKDFSTIIINDFNEKEVEKIMDSIVSALKNYLWKVIEGSEWMEGFYGRW